MDGHAVTLSPVLHSHTSRLSYADTDPAGILYYAAWFPRMERLQSEFMYLQGLRQDTLKDTHGWWTVSRATQCEYLAAAVLFDEIRIDLRVGDIGRSSFKFHHEMVRISDNVTVARSWNHIVTVSPDQKAISIPEGFRAHLDAWMK